MTGERELTALVEAWLPQQRWFAGKGRAATVTLLKLTDLPVPDGVRAEAAVWTARVAYLDGGVELYQLPLVLRPEPTDTLEHVLVGTVPGPDGPLWVYDALHDKDVTQAWPEGMRDEANVGPMSFRRYVDAAQIPVGQDSLVLTSEQSNTSLLYGQDAIMKMFRRLQPGINPEIEVHAALADQPMQHVARMYGSVSASVDSEPCALGMMQEYLATSTDGWDLARASVRDLMAEADLHAEEAGGDFAGEAYRLGAAVAEVHEELRAAFGTASMDLAAVGRHTAAMRQRLDEAQAVVPALGEVADDIRAIYDRLDAQAQPLPVQRIHGDLHLGQSLRTVSRWVIIDFEGEPMADLAERRAMDSTARDVAGMLRSFDYAGHHRIVETGTSGQLAYRAAEWTARNRGAFCDGYADAAGADPRDAPALLSAYEADKAVYETVYEARNRPDWLAIPLGSLTRLTSAA